MASPVPKYKRVTKNGLIYMGKVIGSQKDYWIVELYFAPPGGGQLFFCKAKVKLHHFARALANCTEPCRIEILKRRKRTSP